MRQKTPDVIPLIAPMGRKGEIMKKIFFMIMFVMFFSLLNMEARAAEEGADIIFVGEQLGFTSPAPEPEPAPAPAPVEAAPVVEAAPLMMAAPAPMQAAPVEAAAPAVEAPAVEDEVVFVVDNTVAGVGTMTEAITPVEEAPAPAPTPAPAPAPAPAPVVEPEVESTPVVEETLPVREEIIITPAVEEVEETTQVTVVRPIRRKFALVAANRNYKTGEERMNMNYIILIIAAIAGVTLFVAGKIKKNK